MRNLLEAYCCEDNKRQLIKCQQDEKAGKLSNHSYACKQYFWIEKNLHPTELTELQ